jgi:alpha-tubulin N-acetyltransferase 1
MTIIDELGFASARAQNLRRPITSMMKLRTNPDQRAYIMREDTQEMNDVPKTTSQDDLFMFATGGLYGYRDLVYNERYSVVGMIKMGMKTLFVTDELNRQIEINTLCVLDFYIDESFQRRGYGKRLFEYMLAVVAID